MRGLLGGDAPLGSITGLPPLAGAPISGALIGAGLGGLFDLGQGAVDFLRGEERPKKPWWQRYWALGAGAGALTGLASGVMQTRDPGFLERKYQRAEELSKAGSASDDIVRVLLEDPYLSSYDRARLVAAMQRASPSQLRQLAMAAAAGTLTGVVAKNILGFGLAGSAVVGGLAAIMANNLMPGKTRYV